MAGEKTSPANLQILNLGLADRTFLGIHWFNQILKMIFYSSPWSGGGGASLFLTYQYHKFVISSKKYQIAN